MYNVYDNPNEFGLEIVDSLSEDLSYEFNILLVVKHKQTGRLFYEKDSGCSCPTPFENVVFRSVNDTSMTEITPANIESFISNVTAFPATYKERSAMIKLVKAQMKKDAKPKSAPAAVVSVPTAVEPELQPLPKLAELIAKYKSAIGIVTSNHITYQIMEHVLSDAFAADLLKHVELNKLIKDLYI